MVGWQADPHSHETYPGVRLFVVHCVPVRTHVFEFGQVALKIGDALRTHSRQAALAQQVFDFGP
jgi:hypothetical protein